MDDYAYVGKELAHFASATNWKSYLHSQIEPYLGSEVLEVGAGFGATTRFLCRKPHRTWVCLEPDRNMVDRLQKQIDDHTLPQCCQAEVGTLQTISPDSIYDSLLYIDVAEHIEDDRAELQCAMRHLRPGGYLVVLSPAHNFFFSAFDKAIGHFRRYNKASLTALSPGGRRPQRLRYLDSAGLLISLGSRILQAKAPSPWQIKVWDKLFVPLSRKMDPLLGYRVGKSILGIWQKD